MQFVLIGLSHHTAPIDIRERLSVAEHSLPTALNALLEYPGIHEAVILSTCNRVELYAIVDSATVSQAYDILTDHLANYHHLARHDFASHLYVKSGNDAALHLMRVASGLDSLVLGEMQILGQVRQAMRVAQETESIGTILTSLFQQAITVSRRVQNETGIGRGAFSIGHAAVDLASHIFADLSQATVLVLGAGKMSELTVRHLLSSGVKFLIVANRTFDRAERMANLFGGRAIHYDAFPEALQTADIVIASTAAPHTILRKDLLQPIVRRRRGKPLFLIDIAVPRDIDADVEELENVFLYNIDDLQSVVEEEANQRVTEALRAGEIAQEESEKFMAWYNAREAVPIISQLKARLEQIRQEDLAILRGKLGTLSDREWQAIEQATQSMMKRVAREPILRLKQELGSHHKTERERYDLLDATAALFALDSPDLPTEREERSETR